jgi:hypothetical protein
MLEIKNIQYSNRIRHTSKSFAEIVLVERAEMDALRGLTDQINVFVRLFESINYLFCQIRWLEQNIQNSSKMLLLVVGVIGMICYFVYNSTLNNGDNDAFFAEASRIVVSYFPIMAVVLLVAFFLVRRFSGTTDGALGESGGFDGVLFGTRRNPDSASNRDDDIESRIALNSNSKNNHR